MFYFSVISSNFKLVLFWKTYSGVCIIFVLWGILDMLLLELLEYNISDKFRSSKQQNNLHVTIAITHLQYSTLQHDKKHWFLVETILALYFIYSLVSLDSTDGYLYSIAGSPSTTQIEPLGAFLIKFVISFAT